MSTFLAVIKPRNYPSYTEAEEARPGRRRLLGQWTTSPLSFYFVEKSHHITLPLITQWAKDMQPSDYAGGK